MNAFHHAHIIITHTSNLKKIKTIDISLSNNNFVSTFRFIVLMLRQKLKCHYNLLYFKFDVCVSYFVLYCYFCHNFNSHSRLPIILFFVFFPLFFLRLSGECFTLFKKCIAGVFIDWLCGVTFFFFIFCFSNEIGAVFFFLSRFDASFVHSDDKLLYNVYNISSYT